MSNEEELNCVVIFTPEEMEIFNQELELELSTDELEARMGMELPSVQALYEIVNDPPPGVPAEHYHDYAVYADIKNPIALIIDGEQEDKYFRIRRPKDYSAIEDVLQGILDDRLEAKRQQDDWAEEDYRNSLQD